MKSINIYTLTSPLHDETSIIAQTKEFLSSLNIDYQLKGEDFSDYGISDLSLIYVRTGGTEELFIEKLPQITKVSKKIYLLTSGKSNSLAASMEILSCLKMKGLQGEIIHGEAKYIKEKIEKILLIERGKINLSKSILGVVGKPSNWLISSGVNYSFIKEKVGLEIVDIQMQDLLQYVTNDLNLEDSKVLKSLVAEFYNKEFTKTCSTKDEVKSSIDGAMRIYLGLKRIITERNLSGLTIRCFDLLTSVKNTGCLALAKLNSDGYIAGCEGDIPTAISMLIVKKLLGHASFQANPARVNIDNGELLFAHCTVPFSIVDRYELDSHFESGIGVGVRGFIPKGKVTIFKTQGDLNRYFIEEGELLENGEQNDLCRTQQLIKLSNKDSARYFLENPIGNHHVIIRGSYKQILEDFMSELVAI